MKWTIIVIAGVGMLITALLFGITSERHPAYTPSAPGATFPAYSNAQDVSRSRCQLSFVTRDSVDNVLAFYVSEGFGFSDKDSGAVNGLDGYYWWSSQEQGLYWVTLSIDPSGNGLNQVRIWASVCCDGL
jgi:hypothetical protein